MSASSTQKRFESIRFGTKGVTISYQAEGVDPGGKSYWPTTPVWMEVLSTALEAKVNALADLLLDRAGYGLVVDAVEIKALFLKYTKYGPKLGVKVAADGERCPKPIPLEISGITVAQEDGSNFFTTSQEAALLSEICTMALAEADEALQAHRAQTSLFGVAVVA